MKNKIAHNTQSIFEQIKRIDDQGMVKIGSGAERPFDDGVKL
jgi:hypothetical protein